MRRFVVNIEGFADDRHLHWKPSVVRTASCRAGRYLTDFSSQVRHHCATTSTAFAV